MQVPVVFSLLVALSELDQAADKFGIGEVFVVVQIEQDFVARHRFEIQEVVDRSFLVLDIGTN